MERDKFDQPVGFGDLEKGLLRILEDMDANTRPGRSILAYVADVINLVDMAHANGMVWLVMESADVAGKIGESTNQYGTAVSVHVCEACHLIFTVCPTATDKKFGKGCMTPGCATYDVHRDADLMFGIEPWRIKREALIDPPGGTPNEF